MSKKYGPECYDGKLSLKIPVCMWLAIIYLLHPPAIYIAAKNIHNMTAAKNLHHLLYADSFHLALAVLTSIRVFVFLYAWLSKNADSSYYIRTIWRDGKTILCTVAIFQVTILVLPVFSGISIHYNTVVLVRLVILAIIIAYLLFSPHVKDVLQDFPTYKPKDKPTYVK